MWPRLVAAVSSIVLAASMPAQYAQHLLEYCDPQTPYCVDAADLDGDGDNDPSLSQVCRARGLATWVGAPRVTVRVPRGNGALNLSRSATDPQGWKSEPCRPHLEAARGQSRTAQRSVEDLYGHKRPRLFVGSYAGREHLFYDLSKRMGEYCGIQEAHDPEAETLSEGTSRKRSYFTTLATLLLRASLVVMR